VGEPTTAGDTVPTAAVRPLRTRRRSFFSDALQSTAAQAATALLNVASLAIISRRLGEDDLGLYTLERRACALIQPFVLLGVTVATPRFIAVALGRVAEARRSYAVTGGVIVAGMAAVIAAVIAAWPHAVAAAAFGDPGSTDLALALAGFVVAAALYQIVYSIFRGYLRMGRANALELATIGAIPAAVAIAGPTDFVAFMWSLTAAMLCATVLAAASAARRRRSSRQGSWRPAWSRARELLAYGLPRTPGDFAVIAPFALAPIAVVHFADPAQAGYASVVLSTLNLVSVVAGPLGVLLLPYVAEEVGRRTVQTRRTWVRLAEATLDVALGLAALLFLGSRFVVLIWFPGLPAHVVAAQQVVALGIPGYVFYLVFRSYLDAIDVRPLSSVATVAGLLSLAVALPLLLISPLPSAALAASAAVAISVTAMGAVTWRLVARRLPETLEAQALIAPALAAAAIIASSFAVSDAGSGILAGALILATLAYGGLLAYLRRPWLRELMAMLRVKESAV
jgi:O-antigen/teichoic acid export membrane protein